jgi:hypothetical protein
MKLKIPAQFQFAAAFSEGLGGIELADKWGYIDKNRHRCRPSEVRHRHAFSRRTWKSEGFRWL